MFAHTSFLLAVTTLLTGIAATPPCAFGQLLRFGVVGGTNLTRDFHTTNDNYLIPATDQPAYQMNVLFYSKSHSPILGPMMEVSLPRNFSVGVNALRRDLRSTQVVTSLFPNGTRQANTVQFLSAKTWEYPVLLKYTLPISRLRPFVEAGPSFRTWQEPEAVQPAHYGVTAGLGLSTNWGKFRFSPVVRYTRWVFDGEFPLRATNSDQVELLGSFSYGTEPGSRSLAGRRIWLGLVAGTTATDSFHPGEFSVPTTESRPVVGGLSLEVELGNRLSLEVDGLYVPLHAVQHYPEFNGLADNFGFTVLTWQFPVLAKYRLSASRLAPFLEGGPSLRKAGNTNGYNPSKYGVTVGAGLETRAGPARLAPQVRYSRWAKDGLSPFTYGPAGYDYPRTASNQVEVLLGFSF